MARRRPGDSGEWWWWAALAAFLVGFVFLREVLKDPELELAGNIVLGLAALVYVTVVFPFGLEGGRAGRILRESLALGGAFLLLVQCTPLAEYLAAPLLVRPDVDRAEVIVVLGGGVHPNGVLTTASLERALHGVALYRRGLALHLLFSGGAPGEAPRPEAAAMAEFARLAGIPEGAILEEGASRTTHENAVESVRILRARRIHRVLLVTSAPHMYRAVLAFRREGVEVLPAPVQTREGLRYFTGGPLALFFAALHEYGGLATYKARGWI
jgi:uncharacterized SAM-binding protein YcdF (DUF218 family)